MDYETGSGSGKHDRPQARILVGSIIHFSHPSRVDVTSFNVAALLHFALYSRHIIDTALYILSFCYFLTQPYGKQPLKRCSKQ